MEATEINQIEKLTEIKDKSFEENQFLVELKCTSLKWYPPPLFLEKPKAVYKIKHNA